MQPTAGQWSVTPELMGVRQARPLGAATAGEATVVLWSSGGKLGGTTKCCGGLPMTELAAGTVMLGPADIGESTALWEVTRDDGGCVGNSPAAGPSPSAATERSRHDDPSPADQSGSYQERGGRQAESRHVKGG